MRIRLVFLALGALLVPAAPAHAGDAIMPLSEVHGGMRCTALSVVRGTDIVGFDIEVIDVVAGQQGAPDPRILVRASGPAIDATGLGPGFSGSPIYCPDSAGTPRSIGAISEAIGEYGGKVVLATPIEAILGETADPPRSARRDPGMLRSARPLAAPLTITGLHPELARRVTAAGRRVGRPVLATPPGPVGAFAPQELRPGAAVSVGASSGDLSVGAVGTVAYADNGTVWAFGHPFESVGPRSLLLQDAYVYTVVNNPFGVDPAVTYKLASPGHDLGMLQNDATSAVVGRLGALPRTIPVQVTAADVAASRRATVDLRAADETALGNPNGSSALSLVGPLAVTQAGTKALRGIPARMSGTMCMRITLEERERPIRFCNRYVSGGAPEGDAGGLGALVTDYSNAVNFLDAYNFGPLHVTGVQANLKLQRGLRQGFMTRARGPRRVRRGSRVPVTLTVRRVNGPTERMRFRLRIPRSLPTGPVEMELRGTAAELFTDTLVIDFDQLLSDNGEDGPDPGDPGPTTVEELAQSIEGLRRFDGVLARFTRPGRQRVITEIGRAHRDTDIRISGKTTLTFRVVG